MINYNQEQRTNDWYRERLGIITGSKVSVILGKGRAKDAEFSVSGYSYLYQLAAERCLADAIVDDDVMFDYYLDQTQSISKAMRFGIEQEPEARREYEKITGLNVSEVGLCKHSKCKSLASSPDGIVEDESGIGCIEIKCPTPSVYAEYRSKIRDNDTLQSVQPDYYCQCQNHMACTGAVFCDFIAFNPFMESPIHIVRIKRDEDFISKITERASLAENAIEDIVKRMREYENG